MMRQEDTDFEGYWPRYLADHRHPTNQWLHTAGLLGAVGFAGLALATRKPALLLASAAVGFGAAYIGHQFVEKNQPEHLAPLHSARAYLRMAGLVLSGQMAEEMHALGLDPHGELSL